ncbi:hypothetical protein A249_20755, partial [Pseudomonas syringae pv. actinidiae ICMP 18804]
MTQQEKALDLPKGKDILNWKIKTLARSPKEIMIAQSIFSAIHLTGSSLFMWGGWKVFLKNPPLLVGLILALGGVLAYFIGLLIRQKTIYNYTLKTDGLLTGSLLFLIGPVAMAVVAAVKLLNWENPVHHRQTAPWHLHEFVTVDHKRLMVIIHCDDVTTGFA